MIASCLLLAPPAAHARLATTQPTRTQAWLRDPTLAEPAPPGPHAASLASRHHAATEARAPSQLAVPGYTAVRVANASQLPSSGPAPRDDARPFASPLARGGGPTSLGVRTQRLAVPVTLGCHLVTVAATPSVQSMSVAAAGSPVNGRATAPPTAHVEATRHGRAPAHATLRLCAQNRGTYPVELILRGPSRSALDAQVFVD